MASCRPLTKKEQQMEEIREKVKNSPFYYEKISLEEMKEIERTLDNHVEESSTSTSEKITKNTSDSSENMPLPSFSYRKAMSNNLRYSSDKEFEKGDSNVDCDLMSSKNNLNNENSNSNGESICNKNTNLANDDYPPLSNKSNMKHNKEFQPRENRKMWNQRRNPQDRWRLDPLNLRMMAKMITVIQKGENQLLENRLEERDKQRDTKWEQRWEHWKKEMDARETKREEAEKMREEKRREEEEKRKKILEKRMEKIQCKIDESQKNQEMIVKEWEEMKKEMEE